MSSRSAPTSSFLIVCCTAGGVCSIVTFISPLLPCSVAQPPNTAANPATTTTLELIDSLLSREGEPWSARLAGNRPIAQPRSYPQALPSLGDDAQLPVG